MTQAKAQPSGSPDSDDVIGPAKVTSLHVWNRPATDKDMKPITGKTACTKWSPLEAAYHQGKLGPKDSHDAIRRLNAGLQYSKTWDTAQSAGRDSTQAFVISRGSNAGSISQSQADAVRALVAVESHLSQRDRLIVRGVCGMGQFPSEAVAMVSPDYVKSTSARFREALDSLIEAFEAVRRGPGRVAV